MRVWWCKTRGTASYPQRLALLVEQVGDVLRHPLHQVPGVVPLDLELALLLIVNLQRGSTQGESNTRSPETNCSISEITQVTQRRDAIDLGMTAGRLLFLALAGSRHSPKSCWPERHS